MKIPFVDLHQQYTNIKNEIDIAMANVISETAFIRGKYVANFEKEFAAKNGVKHCIGVANGTDAIYIILKMLGIGKGDEVITTSHSWIATSETITQAGARPVFVDTDDYYLIDSDKIEDKITNKTKAIIPVHLFGQACDMDKIMKTAKNNNLFVIEDCAQAHFAEYKGLKVGSFGIASTFSFYPGKNLGAYGDAGAIITDNDELSKKCRMYANHGSLIKHQHIIEGINSRLDGLQAAILSVKLKYIDEWNELRNKKAILYNELLANIHNIKIPNIKSEVKHIFHVYCILAERRDELRSFLKENEVETQIHYPSMLPFMPAYGYLGYHRNDFPRAAIFQEHILGLPMYPEISNESIEFITNLIKKFYQ